MEKTTSRIDSEAELAKFIHKLMMADIKIPSNVTLEIDSPTLKSVLKNNFFKTHRLDTSNIEDVNITRCTYMGEKISFKSE